MKKIFFSFVLPAVILLLIFLPGMLIKVRIVCKSQNGGCPGALESSLSSFNGKSLFASQKKIKSVLRDNYLVSNFGIQFKLPNILYVDILTKEPVFALKNKSGELYSLIDSDGFILESSSTANLPYAVTTENLPGVGEKVSKNNLTALELIDGVDKMYQTRSGDIEGDTLLVELPGPVRVIFPLANTDSSYLLGSLRLIYSNMEGDEKYSLYKEIDLRYINPVLR